MHNLIPVFVGACVFLGCGSSDPGGSSGVDSGPAVDGAPAVDAPSVGAADGATPAVDAAGGTAVTFTRHTVDGAAAGPAYVSVADVDDDGSLDLVVSQFGVVGGLSIPNGRVTLYRRTGDLGQWTGQDIVGEADAIKFPNQTTVDDVDGDGDLDVIVPYGFLACTAIPFGSACGGLAWFEQAGDAWLRHDLVANGSALFYHLAVLVDFDGDGVRDLVTTGEEKGGMMGGSDRAVTVWFRGDDDAPWFDGEPREIGSGGGSLPQVIDLDGDDDLDVASAEYFAGLGGSFVWFERTADPGPGNPAGSFVRHVIADDVGPSIMLTVVDDLFGDGVRHAIGANHSNTAQDSPDPWESAVYLLDLPDDPRQPWPKTKISTGIESVPGSMMAPMAAPGIFGVGDMDDDGDLDLVVSGDGDPDVLWFEQTGVGSFASHVLESPLSQAGGVTVADLDGDGDHETVVTGYEANVVYLYSHD